MYKIFLALLFYLVLKERKKEKVFFCVHNKCKINQEKKVGKFFFFLLTYLLTYSPIVKMHMYGRRRWWWWGDFVLCLQLKINNKNLSIPSSSSSSSSFHFIIMSWLVDFNISYPYIGQRNFFKNKELKRQ